MIWVHTPVEYAQIDINLIEPLIHWHLKRYILYSIKRGGGGGDLFSLLFSEKLIGGRSSYEKNKTILLPLWNIKKSIFFKKILKIYGENFS